MRNLAPLFRKTWLADLSIIIFAGLIYQATLAPGVYGFDSAELVTGVYTQGIVHPPGFPLYLLVGKLFSSIPVGSISLRLNMMSAVFAVLTVYIIYKTSSLIFEDKFASWVSSLIFSASYFFWQMALVAEVYTLYTSLLAIDLLVIVWWIKTGKPKHLLLFSFFYGLTLSTHTSGILFAPGFTWLILTGQGWTKKCWKWTGLMFSVFLLGLTPYLYLMSRASLDLAMNYTLLYPEVDLTRLSGLWWYISGQAYHMFAFGYSLSEIPGEVIWFLTTLWRNFIGIGVILGVLGTILYFNKNRPFVIGLNLLIFFQAAFFVNYRVLDKDTMLLPSYLVWTFLLTAGIIETKRFVQTNLIENISAAKPVQFLINGLLVIVIALQVLLNIRWVDMRTSSGYAEFVQASYSVMESNSTIFAPWSIAVVLEYYQIVEGYRPDLVVINQARQDTAWYYEMQKMNYDYSEIIDKIQDRERDLIILASKESSVYLVEYAPILAEFFSFLPTGPLFKLEIR